MIQINKNKFEQLIDKAESVYSFENTLFVITKNKTWIARNVDDSCIKFAINCYHERLSRDLKKILDKNDEYEKVIKKHYRHSSIQHMANILKISPYKVQIVIDRLLLSGQISKNNRKNTKWGAFIKANYKIMDKKSLIEVTGMTRSGINRVIAILKAEEEQNEFI